MYFILTSKLLVWSWSFESQLYSIHYIEKKQHTYKSAKFRERSLRVRIDISSSFQFQRAQISTCLRIVLQWLYELANDFLAKYRI